MHCLAFSISLNTVGAVIELSILLYCNFTKKLSRFQFSNTRFLDLSIYISNQTLFPLDLHFLPPPPPPTPIFQTLDYSKLHKLEPIVAPWENLPSITLTFQNFETTLCRF